MRIHFYHLLERRDHVWQPVQAGIDKSEIFLGLQVVWIDRYGLLQMIHARLHIAFLPSLLGELGLLERFGWHLMHELTDRHSPSRRFLTCVLRQANLDIFKTAADRY